MCVCAGRKFTPMLKILQSMAELVHCGNAQINHNVLKVSESSKC